MSEHNLPPLDQPKPGRLTISYLPGESAEIVENPPRFSWIPVVEDEAGYTLRLSQDGSFPAARTTVFDNIAHNFFTPASAIAPGEYHWSYAACDPATGKPVTQWSRTRSFSIANDLAETPLPDRDVRFANATQAHPRLWMAPDRLSAFRDGMDSDQLRDVWATFVEKSVLPWMDRDIMAEPAGYPDNTRTASVWRQTYIDCQELLYAIRHLAVGGKVLEDRALIERAKVWLLSAAEWDPDGTTSRSYTDEWAFRVVLALAWGYDWLYDELDVDEEARVRAALLARTRQVAHHVTRQARIQLFPFDSHAVRSVSSVLVPACIALLDEEPEAREWLDFSVEFLWSVYSPWGDAEGGWAEGPHYWMTGMAYLIDAANLLKSYAGLDLYRRPFFQRTADFPLYTKAPDTRRGTFGDDSTMGDLPCLKIGYNLRQFAGVTGNGSYQWYFEEILKNDPGTEMEFYNWGWWDLNFDDLVYRNDFPEIKAVPPSDAEALRLFKGVGWAAVQLRADNPAEHLHLVFKSSPYGSISHSHGDQNAFTLSAFGEDLLVQSGHYVAFNSTMHQNWRRQTRSKNAILINGEGQYAGRDKARAMQATGSIVLAEQHDDHIHIRGDATAAYASLTPTVTAVLRDLYLVHGEYLVIVDSVDADEAVTIDWLLHTNGPLQLGKSSFRFTGDRAGFYGETLWSEAGPPTFSQFDGYPDVAPSEYEGLAIGSRLSASFPAARRHRIATLLVPYPTAGPRRVFHFLDDQGYDCDLYFTDSDERSFKLTLQKLAKV